MIKLFFLSVDDGEFFIDVLAQNVEKLFIGGRAFLAQVRTENVDQKLQKSFIGDLRKK